MQLKNHVQLMAEYNQWMNTKLYDACAKLSHDAFTENRKAFFGSISGTLNHLVVADIMWLQRLGAALGAHQELAAVMQLPTPESLDTILQNERGELIKLRQMLDETFLALAAALTENELQQTFAYKNTRGVAFNRPLFSVLMHVFNHQTHHRGQTTTLLTQAGLDVGVTDLLAIIPNR